MTSIGTTAAGLIFATSRPTSFLIHADSANTDKVRISSTDPLVVQDYDEMNAGDDLSFTDFVGVIYGLAASGTQKVYVPFVVVGMSNSRVEKN